MEDEIEYRCPPTGRPLAEPPTLHYEKFVVEAGIPSDARLRRLFEKDIAFGYRYRDVLTERKLLDAHLSWATDLQVQEIDEERRVFYKDLREELWVDLVTVETPVEILNEAFEADVISNLGLWEYYRLDEDGGTTRIQEELQQRNDIFRSEAGRAAFEKYGHLADPDFYADIEKRLLAEETAMLGATIRYTIDGMDEDWPLSTLFNGLSIPEEHVPAIEATPLSTSNTVLTLEVSPSPHAETSEHEHRDSTPDSAEPKLRKRLTQRLRSALRKSK